MHTFKSLIILDAHSFSLGAHQYKNLLTIFTLSLFFDRRWEQSCIVHRCPLYSLRGDLRERLPEFIKQKKMWFEYENKHTSDEHPTYSITTIKCLCGHAHNKLCMSLFSWSWKSNPWVILAAGYCDPKLYFVCLVAIAWQEQSKKCGDVFNAHVKILQHCNHDNKAHVILRKYLFTYN